MGHRQKTEGAHRVGGKGQQQPPRHTDGNTVRQRHHRRRHQIDSREQQQSPRQRKGQTHPAPQIPKDPGVVPERHAQKGLPPPVVNILHGGGGQTTPDVERPPGAKVRRQGQHRRHTQSVHRAERQDQQTPSPPPGRPGHGSKQPLQPPSQKAEAPENPQKFRHVPPSLA